MRVRTDCRACRGKNLAEVFSLGEQPYANAYVRPEDLHQPEPVAPLELMQCDDCGMVQLKHVVSPDNLFRDYCFQTSSSSRMMSHFADLMAEAVDKYVPFDGIVVEIGSNDGSALASIQRPDIVRLGIDPAENLAATARTIGVPTISDFFTSSVASSVARELGKADLIVAANVLGHIDDLDDLFMGIKILLKPRGAMVIEVPELSRLVNGTEFDTIYHEHLSYFDQKPLSLLAARHGFQVVDFSRHETHGGSMRLTISHGNVKPCMASKLHDWHGFRQRCNLSRSRLMDFLTKQRLAGQTVWGYGAPAKATVRLNFCNVGTDLMPAIVDCTPQKQGRHVPGTHQAILTPAELLAQQPDVAVVLAWNHYTEIVVKEWEFVASGGRFCLPMTY